MVDCVGDSCPEDSSQNRRSKLILPDTPLECLAVNTSDHMFSSVAEVLSRGTRELFALGYCLGRRWRHMAAIQVKSPQKRQKNESLGNMGGIFRQCFDSHSLPVKSRLNAAERSAAFLCSKEV